MVMNNDFNNPGGNFMQYLEYLYSMGCTLDENGNVVPIDNGNKKLELTPDDYDHEYDEDEDDEYE